MLQPKNRKYRKDFKGNSGKILGKAKNPNVCFGDYGMQSIEACRLTGRQIEAARRVISRSLKRQGKVWIRVFPDKPITSKPLEVRQGKGKGNVEYYVFLVKPGTVIFEIAGVSEEVAKAAIKSAGGKMPFKIKFIKSDKVSAE